jgi:RimJ/RimL family protein N-acetyltransferase
MHIIIRDDTFKEIELRGWKNSDKKRLFRLISNPHILDNLGDNYSTIHNGQNLADYLRDFDNPKSENVAIVINNEVIGGLGMYINNANNGGIIEYWLTESFWNKGIMSKVVKTFTQYNLKKPEIERLEAHVYVWNEASMHVLKKSGYKYKQTKLSNHKKNNDYVNIKVYEISKEELK